MECELEAYPAPDIVWYQGSKVILDTGRIRMTKKSTGKDTHILKLEINDPVPEDGGAYRCNACNVYGESNANIALNFQGITFFTSTISNDDNISSPVNLGLKITYR